MINDEGSSGFDAERRCAGNFSSQESMVALLGHFWEVVELLQLASSTNWFGLGCPYHCGPSSFPSLGLSFILGLISGALIGFSIAWTLFRSLVIGPPPGSTSRPTDLPLSRLRGYVV